LCCRAESEEADVGIFGLRKIRMITADEAC
jgi:hypothetical protein